MPNRQPKAERGSIVETDAKAALSVTTPGTDITRFNALRHGLLSRYTVLPWENEREYHALVSALVAEHAPQGPTEEHLVEEVAGIIWRKRRLRLSEGATHRQGLEGTLDPNGETVKAALVHLDAAEQSERVVDAIRATSRDTQDDIRDILDNESVTRHALKILEDKRGDAYESALAALREDTREWWAERLVREPDELYDGKDTTAPDRDGLRQFIEREVLPWFENRKKELANRPLIREQAFGESLDVYKLERLSRYEVHLDRKLERMLAMLLRLKDLRQGAIEE
jgi:hypothetical protein